MTVRPQPPTPTPLVMLPGTLCDDAVFEPLIQALRLSDRTNRPISIDSLEGGGHVTAVARRVLQDAPGRFALAGYSLGGIVAIQIALIAPHRVAGLCLIDSNARAVPLPQQATRRREAQLGAGNLSGYVRDTLWPGYVAPGCGDDPALLAKVQDMAKRVGAEALLVQTELALSRPDTLARLPALAMPALVVAGVSDALAPPAVQQEMAAALSNAVLSLVPGAGHLAPFEQPETVAASMTAWLASSDAFECGRLVDSPRIRGAGG